MRHRWTRHAGAAALALAAWPGLAYGQPAQGFGDLERRVKPGQIVIVDEPGGRRIKGQVAEVSPSELAILTREPDQPGAAWTSREVFSPSSVTRIRRTGPIWDGAVKGAAIGGGAALIAALNYDAQASLAASASLFWGGVGAGIGLGIDAAFGPKTVYRASASSRRVSIGPMMNARGRGVLATMRF